MLRFFKGLFSFKGRISRGTFWLYHLALLPVGIVGFVGFVGLASLSGSYSNGGFGFAGIVFLFVFGWIFRSLFVRRLHDLGRSGTIFKNPFREQKDMFDAYFKRGQPFKNQYDVDQADQ